MKNKSPKTFSIWCFAGIIFTFIIFQTAVFAQAVFDLPALYVSAERPLKKDEKHIYQIRLEQNQFAQVRVEELGVGVYLSAYDPNGNLILTSESRDRTLGRETVSVIAVAGVYRFEIGTTLAPVNGAGKYRIRLAVLRETITTDSDLLETERIFMAAMKSASDESFVLRRESLNQYAQAAAGFQRHNDLARAAVAFNLLGFTQNQLGEKRTALENYQKALTLFREIGDLHNESVALRFISAWYNLAGEPEKAIELLSQSLAISRKIRNTNTEASALQRLADVYSQLGEIEKAIGLYEQALNLREDDEAQGINTGYILLNRIGDLQARQKNWKKALELYLLAVEADKKRSGGKNFPINSFWRIGRMYMRLGDASKALAFLNDGQKREEKIRAPQRLGHILLGLGEVHYALGDKQKASELFRESAATFQTISNSSGEAFARFSAAQAERDLGNLDQAQSEIEKTLQLVESLRSRLINQDFRVSYFATTADYYDFYLELLWQRRTKNPQGHYDRQAWAVTERARARTLSEMLREAKIDIRQGVALELLEQERNLQTALNEKADLHLQLSLSKNAADAAESARVGKEIENLSVELGAAQTKIRQTSPRYAALVQPSAPNLKEVQNALDAETVILEYKLGAGRSFLWLIGRDFLEQHELAPREEIENLARRFYNQTSSRQAETPAETEKTSEDLSRLLLGEVQGKIKNKRLLVVADGALQLVPFAALRNPKSQVPGSQSIAQYQSQILKSKASKSDSGLWTPDSGQFLVEANEIINLPSASILPVLRENSPVRLKSGKTLALFADAVFTGEDVRLPPEKKSPKGQIEIKLNMPDSRLKLARLPFSRREANAILAIASPKETFAAIGFAANRETVLKMNLAQFRIVHFATHGWLDAERPQLSGIVLSLVDERGGRLNGFLRLHEIYNLDLAADLVVLSACQTGLGKTVSNEGVIGLTRGFMYAGASRVMSSLWNVDDAATAELMQHFYQNLLIQKMTPAAALRTAQISLVKEKRWHNPYFWAAFSIQGEWR